MSAWETLDLNEDYREDHIYILELNRPEAMNSLNTKMGVELIECLKSLEDLADLRVLIITAKGDRSFCAGADLKERKGMTNEEWKQQHIIFENAYEKLRNFKMPVIAMVNGYALGGGMEMVLSCDLRYASDHVELGLPESRLGIIPGVGGTQLLPRAIPVGLAKELLYRGNRIEAKKAFEIGLLNAVFSKEELFSETLKIAKEIGSNAPLSLQALKKAVSQGLQTDLETGIEIELNEYYKCANSTDRNEGVLAFNEKRNPVWQGR